MRNIYIVGPAGSQAEFASIQDAIDQAVLDGHDGADPANIEILPGMYVEDVAMAAGINVFGTSLAVVDGTVTIDLVAQVDQDNTQVTWRQVTIAPTGAGAMAVHFTGTTFQRAIFLETIVRPGDGEAVVVDNTGVFGVNTSLFAMAQCTVESAVAGALLFRIVDSFVYVTLSLISHDDLTETAINSTSPNGMFVDTSNVSGRIIVEDSLFFARRLITQAEGASAVNQVASITIFEGQAAINCDTSPAIDGTGVVAYDLISYTLSTAEGIDPVLFQSPFRVERSSHLLYFPGAVADWIAPPPDNVADALDRIAAAVAAAHGPIP